MKKETPILFKAEMVRAILARTKTQTRRLLSHQMPHVTGLGVSSQMHAARGEIYCATYDAFPGKGTARWAICDCPHGIIGTHLWVRETWKVASNYDDLSPRNMGRMPLEEVRYLADGNTDINGKTRVSIFMPRWASRITLEITGIRAERLQDISEADAEAEGIDFIRHYPDVDETLSAKKLFEFLWDSINGKPQPIYCEKRVTGYVSYPWSNESFESNYPGCIASELYRGKPLTVYANPIVWAITFKKL